jgi:hypothetical protein
LITVGVSTGIVGTTAVYGRGFTTALSPHTTVCLSVSVEVPILIYTSRRRRASAADIAFLATNITERIGIPASWILGIDGAWSKKSGNTNNYKSKKKGEF